MNGEKRRNIKAPVVLLILSFVCNTIIQIVLAIADRLELADNWFGFVLLMAVGVGGISYYYISAQKEKKRTEYYVIGFSALAIVCMGDLFGNLPIYVIKNLVYLAICVLMVCLKFIKKNKRIFSVGCCLYGSYAFLIFFLGVEDGLLFGGWLELIALWLIWCDEMKEFKKKKEQVVDYVELENDLKKLKELREMGRISEQEYDEMKTKILNKF
ncbi:MAG: SHOCT domain-containing protein [Lachnospiraceae bacterium]|nr:SHOCT domain-containing protein [Lachnospiraceae bacterium]